MAWYDDVNVNVLLGRTLANVVQNGNDELIFTTTEGEQFRMHHVQDCCESVYIEDICGNLDDLIGAPLLMAEESTNSDDPPSSEYDESHTWTFYRFATINGSVTIRWYGSSNGYYSESVNFERI
jgi:hypothetical protein